MAPRVHLHWCVLACAARSAAEPAPPADQGGFAAERSLADPASFVVVQGLWLPPETAEADAAPQADALPVEGFHGVNAGHGLGWLRSDNSLEREQAQALTMYFIITTMAWSRCRRRLEREQEGGA